MNKYHNKKVECAFGQFDSRLEMNRYIFLLERQREGTIRDLKRQVSFELIPKQTRLKVVQLKTKSKVVEEVVERPCNYIADFCYRMKRGGEWVSIVEDTKGGDYRSGRFSTMTPDFIIKRKLMLYLNNIEVKIVTKSTQEL